MVGVVSGIVTLGIFVLLHCARFRLSRLIHDHWPAAKHMKCEDVCYVFVIHKKARLLSAQSSWLSVRIKLLLIEGGVATVRLLKSLDALCTSSLDRSNS